MTGAVAHHAEGPVWSEAWGGLRFVDLDAGKLLTFDGVSVHTLHINQPIAAFVRPRASGGYVVATERGIGLAEGMDLAPSRFIDLWDDASIRMNDGTVDPWGRLWAGGMAYDARPGAASLFRIDPDLSFRPIVDGVTVSNGIGFSQNGERCFFVDTMTGRVDQFDVLGGELANRRPFVTFDREQGLPDGLTISADGSVWIALWGGSCIHGYSPEGDLHTIVDLPVGQVSACTFGGEQLRTLFITTSRQGLADGVDSEAGSLFAVETGYSGLPVSAFQG